MRGSWRCLLSTQSTHPKTFQARATLANPPPELNSTCESSEGASEVSAALLFSVHVEFNFQKVCSTYVMLVMKPCILSCPVSLHNSVGLRLLDRDLCPRHSNLCTWGPDAMHKCTYRQVDSAHILSRDLVRARVKNIARSYIHSSHHDSLKH